MYYLFCAGQSGLKYRRERTKTRYFYATAVLIFLMFARINVSARGGSGGGSGGTGGNGTSMPSEQTQASEQIQQIEQQRYREQEIKNGEKEKKHLREQGQERTSEQSQVMQQEKEQVKTQSQKQKKWWWPFGE